MTSEFENGSPEPGRRAAGADIGTTAPTTEERPEEKQDDRVLDPGNLDAEHHALEKQFAALLAAGDNDGVRNLACGLSPGDLSEVLRPLNVEDTTAGTAT